MERTMRKTVRRLIPVAFPCMLMLLWGCAQTRPAAPARVVQETLPKVGIALGGGGARGFAEVGVLRVLEQEHIPVDFVAGTSVGSLIGALFCDNGSVVDLEFTSVKVEAEDLFDYSTFAIFSGGFVKGERLEAFLLDNFKHKSIETFRIPYAAVATDLRTGETTPFSRGSAARAVHASAAIPGVFVPVQIEGRTYVDGGASDPVPVDVARKMGAEVVIAVSIARPIPSRAPQNPLEVAALANTIMASKIVECRLNDADVVIAPDVGDVGFNDFSQKRRLLEAGMEAARQALPKIRAAIEARTRNTPLKASDPAR
jgi:NTE family protein